jgi:hypothetical protein
MIKTSKQFNLILIACLVIFLSLVVLGLPRLTSLNLEKPKTTDSQTQVLEKQDTSNEISSIESDLKKTDLADLDKELSEIESELASP